MIYSPLGLQPMQESGGALLRAIQNDSMVPLDLLVRESVQNSLDAALPNEARVFVDFSVRPHSTDAIIGSLKKGIDTRAVKARFPSGGRLLEIRDVNTEGLSGPLDLQDIGARDSHGNLLKLVYEVGRSRHDETAGGSWGLGKTCYFRMGVGLVIFYSRVVHAGAYQERLVACLVENERAVDRLQTMTETGIAWWGTKKGKPITDPSVISTTLMSLGIVRFKENETGTSIIIPFLRNDLIPDAGSEFDRDDELSETAKPRPWWFTKYEDYLTIALQRWFCTRIDNPRFRGGPALAASVSGRPIRASAMMPVFQVVQALYDRLGGHSSEQGDYLAQAGIAPASILMSSISLKNTFVTGMAAGKMMAVLLTREELRMAPPDNQYEPFLHVFGNYESSPPYRPLVTFMRRPGMLVRWDDGTEARGWGGGSIGSSDGRFLIALFLPEQDRPLKDAVCQKLRTTDATLESYLRGCEKADHHHWSDQAGFSIIARMRSQVGKHLKEFGVGVNSKPVSTTALRTARNLADRLLPRGFGTDGRHGPRPPDRTPIPDGLQTRRNSRPSEPNLEVVKIHHEVGGIRLNWVLQWGMGNSPRNIVLAVDSESGPIGSEDWCSDGLGQFPFLISSGKIAGGEHQKLAPPDIKVLVVDQVVLRLMPGPMPADRTEIFGELTIKFLDDIGGTLLPVLRLTTQKDSSEV